MASIVKLPVAAPKNHYAGRLQTEGKNWTAMEKKLLDQAEFLEAMILVLNDVREQNIRERDFAMKEIVTEEISHYQQRLEDIQQRIETLRSQYAEESGPVSAVRPQ